MVLKIEYVLVLVVTLLIGSILGINPTSKEAITSKGNQEVVFKDFSLFEVNVNTSGRQIFAHEASKYTNYLDLKEINISDENGHNILAKRAVYEDDTIFMKDDIQLSRSDGLTFNSTNLSYDIKTEKVETTDTFLLKFNTNQIEGVNLKYSLKGKEISADEIEATIVTE